MKRLNIIIILLILTSNFTFSQNNYKNPPINIDSVSKTDVTCNNFNNGTLTILASGLDSLEYSLDGKDYKLFNKYINLRSGLYTPYVRGSSKIPSSVKVLYEFDITIKGVGNENFSLPGILLITQKIPTDLEKPSNDFDVAFITNQSPSTGENGAIHFATNTSLFNIITPRLNAINQDISTKPSKLNPNLTDITLLPESEPNPYNVFSLSILPKNSPTVEIISGSFQFKFNESQISGKINFEGSSDFSPTSTIYSGTITGQSRTTTKIFESFLVVRGETISITEPGTKSDNFFIPTISVSTDEGQTSDTVYLVSNVGNKNIWFRNGEEIKGQNGQKLKLEESGTYQVKAISMSGCESVSDEYDIDWYPIRIQINVENPTCFGLENGTLSVSATGGEGPLEYSLNGKPFVSKSSFDSLGAGDYTVYVRGAESLNYVESRSFTIREPEQLELIVLEEKGPDCTGENSGSIRVSAKGGSGAYSYRISNPQQSNNTGIFSGLPAGDFMLTVRDQNGCEVTEEVILNAIGDIPPTPTIRIDTDEGPSNVVNLVSSSTSGNIWIWNGIEIEGANEQYLQIRDGGKYEVKVISGSGCESKTSDSLNIKWYPIKISPPVVENPTCSDLENGKLQISATVGEGTLSYSLDGLNYRSGSSFENLPAGEYIFYIRGSQNLNYVENRPFTVSQPEPLALVILEEKGPNCLGENSGIIRASATGGTGPYSFQVSNQQQSNNNGIFQGLPEGVFLLTARDQNGCEAIREVSLETIGQFPPIPVISFRGPDGTPSGVGLVSSSLLNNQWVRDDVDIPGATEQIFVIEQAGVYRVRVASEEGCSSISDPIVLTSLEEEERLIRISMYPNPAEQYVKIDFHKPTEIQMLRIFDMKGLLVKSFEHNLFVEEYLEIDLNGLEAGIYFIHLKNKEFYQVLKLHKQ